VWQRVAGLSLDLCEALPSVSVLNLGGGYKVGRMATDVSTDLAVVGVPVKEAFEAFSKSTLSPTQTPHPDHLAFSKRTLSPTQTPHPDHLEVAAPHGTPP
jgi:hypothetical protein